MARMLVEIPIPPKWKQLWDTWDLRSFIVLSLALQTLLIFVAPFRKRTKSYWIVMPLWSAYLLADSTAIFALGLIANSMGNPVENIDFLAFWAPFLLLHLGGPDTITAFALEDNELWLRHLLRLVFQCFAAVYVFVRSLPYNRLWIPTMLMFFIGIIKYVERTRSLYLASTDRFKVSTLGDPDPGLNYSKLMDEHTYRKEAKLPTSILITEELVPELVNKAKKGKLTELEVVQYGYLFYEKFRGLVADMFFSRKERKQSRDFFLNRNANDAFKVVEVELNFIYEVLFTKLPVVYGKYGAISRVFSLMTVCLAIIIFMMKSKTNFNEVDVTITYGLLFGALVMDLSALFMLFFSDWTTIALRKSPDFEHLDNSLKTRIISALLRHRIESSLQEKSRCVDKRIAISHRRPFAVINRRWSETISTFNLIDYCLHPRPKLWENFSDKLGFTRFLNGIFYAKPKEFEASLGDFIFHELRMKSELADDVERTKQINSARGDWAIIGVEEGWEWADLLKYIVDVDYDESIILWHIATELLYNQELHIDSPHRKISKLLSDYMLYLIIMESDMMSAVAGIAQKRFQDTCAEAKRFFQDIRVFKRNNNRHLRACIEIYEVETAVSAIDLKGHQSKSSLFDGCILAKKLNSIEMKNSKLDKWVTISKVWVELLCYAAINSRANMLAAKVSKGGELITIVWLLMTHFGLGDQFQISDEPKATIIVGK